MPLFRNERSYTFSSALTWVKGKHQVRTGIDVVNHELNHFQAEFGGFGGVRGGFQFGATSPPDARLRPARSGTSSAASCSACVDAAEGRPGRSR